MSHKNENKYVPRNAKRVTFVRSCECVDATSTTGQITTEVQPELGPYARGIQFTVKMIDMVCDVCKTPFTREISEWVPNTEEAARVGQRLIRGRISTDESGATTFVPDDDTVRFNPGGASVMVRALDSREIHGGDEDRGEPDPSDHAFGSNSVN